MIPYLNVILLLLLTTFTGFVLGMIVFSAKREHDFEQDFAETCMHSKHLFPTDKAADEIYCFCGNEVLRSSDNPHYLVVKT